MSAVRYETARFLWRMEEKRMEHWAATRLLYLSQYNAEVQPETDRVIDQTRTVAEGFLKAEGEKRPGKLFGYERKGEVPIGDAWLGVTLRMAEAPTGNVVELKFDSPQGERVRFDQFGVRVYDEYSIKLANGREVKRPRLRANHLDLHQAKYVRDLIGFVINPSRST